MKIGMDKFISYLFLFSTFVLKYVSHSKKKGYMLFEIFGSGMFT